MRPPRHRAYSLVYLLAALPLVALVSTIAIQVVDRALRVQRMATYQTFNDSSMRHLVHSIREDARQADGATADPAGSGRRMHLDGPQQTVIYEVTADQVTRTARLGDGDPSVTNWAFKNAEIAFQIETIPTGKNVAWVQFEYRFEITKGIERKRRLAAAAAVGGGGSP